MNREIKFRITKKVLKNGKIFHIYKDIRKIDIIDFWEGDTYKLLGVTEWAGLKDSNGKEIYEGDVIYVNDYFDAEYYAEIRFNDGKFEWRNNKILKGEYLTKDDIKAFKVKIIGNIFENPELLEQIN